MSPSSSSPESKSPKLIIKCRDIDQAQSYLCNPAPESLKILEDCIIRQQQQICSSIRETTTTSTTMNLDYCTASCSREDLEAVIRLQAKVIILSKTLNLPEIFHLHKEKRENN